VKRIVVGIDGSESSDAALAWAARQADFTDSVLEAVTVWQWPANYGYPMSVPADFHPDDVAKGVLDKALAELPRTTTNRKLEVRKLVLEGYPARILVDASRGAELLVVGSRGHGELTGLVLGSVSQYCVTQAHCPVLVHRH
jgi:nucleotide-binding universal stress UspA family protein